MAILTIILLHFLFLDSIFDIESEPKLHKLSGGFGSDGFRFNIKIRNLKVKSEVI
jgi:hypothetical protein